MTENMFLKATDETELVKRNFKELLGTELKKLKSSGTELELVPFYHEERELELIPFCQELLILCWFLTRALVMNAKSFCRRSWDQQTPKIKSYANMHKT